jgi:hypothetical protein
MLNPLLIGLSGKAGSGKSTAADYLTERYGYVQFAFAGALKEIVQTAFRFTAEQMTSGKEVIDPRVGKSPRWCLQHFGSAFREVWPEVWIYNLRQEILDFLAINGQHPIVVTDVRFRDEAEALRRMEAVLVRLRRPEGHRLEACATGIMGHASEIDLDGWEGWWAGQGNHVIDNNGTMDNLYWRLDTVLAIEADKAELAKAIG